MYYFVNASMEITHTNKTKSEMADFATVPPHGELHETRCL